MSITCVIVDDEKLARDLLREYIQQIPDLEILGEASKGKEAVEVIDKLTPDLIFLDVQMPGMNGFDVLDEINHDPYVIFCTAYDQYALKAFEANALDYLLKPIEDARLDSAIDRARQEIITRGADEHCERLLRLLSTLSGRPDLTLDQALADADRNGGRPTDDRLAIKDAGRILRVPLDDILWIDAAGDYMCVHTRSDTHVLRATMRELEEKLDPRRFQRIHRSTIVNVARVRELRSHLNGEYFLILDSGQQLKLSRSYKDKVRLLH